MIKSFEFFDKDTPEMLKLSAELLSAIKEKAEENSMAHSKFIRKAIEEYLHGILKKPKKMLYEGKLQNEKASFRISKALKEAARKKAKDNGDTYFCFIRQALEAALLE